MHNLIKLTSIKLNLPAEKVVYLAYEYAEKVPHTKKEKLKIAHTIFKDEIPPEVEDFALDTLSGRSKPL